MSKPIHTIRKQNDKHIQQNHTTYTIKTTMQAQTHIQHTHTITNQTQPIRQTHHTIKQTQHNMKTPIQITAHHNDTTPCTIHIKIIQKNKHKITYKQTMSKQLNRHAYTQDRQLWLTLQSTTNKSWRTHSQTLIHTTAYQELYKH